MPCLATRYTLPPRPPSPPSGPPKGTNFSRRNDTTPLPPSPAFTQMRASSTSIGMGDQNLSGGCFRVPTAYAQACPHAWQFHEAGPAPQSPGLSKRRRTPTDSVLLKKQRTILAEPRPGQSTGTLDLEPVLVRVDRLRLAAGAGRRRAGDRAHAFQSRAG